MLAGAPGVRPSVHVALHHRGRHEEPAEDEARSAEPFEQTDGVLAAAEVSAARERGLVGNEPVGMNKNLVVVRGGSLDMVTWMQSRFGLADPERAAFWAML